MPYLGAVSVFFAVHLAESLGPEVSALLRVVERRAPSCARVLPADAHITLAFLGHLEPERVERAREIGRAARGEAFDLPMGALGTFGGRAPRVLWWGPAALPAGLTTLQRALSEDLGAAGFTLDERPYAPHLTLARARGRAAERELAALVQEVAAPRARAHADAFVLMRTARGGAEARYEVIESFPLASTGGAPLASDGGDTAWRTK